MNLYILRHGLAVEPGSRRFAKDADRPLTPKGKRKMGKIARGMQAMELDFDLILSSPYARARQTAELVAAEFKKKVEFADALKPDGSARRLIDLLDRLQPRPGNVLLVGHEPYLSELVALLISGDTAVSVVMKKGGLCKLSSDALAASRCAVLEWLLTPKQMRLMS